MIVPSPLLRSRLALFPLNPRRCATLSRCIPSSEVWPFLFILSSSVSMTHLLCPFLSPSHSHSLCSPSICRADHHSKITCAGFSSFASSPCPPLSFTVQPEYSSADGHHTPADRFLGSHFTLRHSPRSRGDGEVSRYPHHSSLATKYQQLHLTQPASRIIYLLLSRHPSHSVHAIF
jgi:hypothetical protein